ncbi:MAG: hypothetical protein A3F17_02665 [Gammaproteobacteria bacterium RIFCSPHIGHO2_12_FULL_41_15]|nr:MAG: hypothetical protein A3F17_02665 [Gammaproteobacteria bacterium RIFCSPHIGHO2_12_FULL_41_15]
MKISKLLSKLNWTNSLFLTITPVVGFAALAYLIDTHSIYWQTILLMVIFTFIGGISITAGYHRLFSHNTYKAHPIIAALLAFFGAGSFEGSVLEWCTDHRNHHRYTDTDKDPYNSKRGFWYSHIGWLFVLDNSKRDYSNVDDLSNNKMLRLQHRFYLPVAVTSGMLVPMAIGALWGDALGGLLLAGVLRIVLNQHFTFCINSFCHMLGKRTYSDRITARDNWFTALVTYGEGYHNFHHQFPLDYRNAIKSYQYDPTKWLIYGLSKVGLTSDLRKVKQSLIVQYKLRMDEQNMLAKAERNAAIKEHVENALRPVQEAIMTTLTKLEELEKSYANFKAIKDHLKMVDCRKNLKAAKYELKYSLKKWKNLISHADRLALAAV